MLTAQSNATARRDNDNDLEEAEYYDENDLEEAEYYDEDDDFVDNNSAQVGS